MNKKDSLITELVQKEIPFITEEEEEFEQIETTNNHRYISQPAWYKEWLIKKVLMEKH